MLQRGRKSAESLSVVPVALPQRPEPPAELSIEEAQVWRDYVNDMPNGWFTPKTFPDLANLCGLVIGCRLLRQELRQFEDGIPKDLEGFHQYQQMKKLYVKDLLAITTLETKLRLTHQSKDDPHSARAAASTIAAAAKARPWKTIDD